jgi:hypothetical protein
MGSFTSCSVVAHVYPLADRLGWLRQGTAARVASAAIARAMSAPGLSNVLMVATEGKPRDLARRAPPQTQSLPSRANRAIPTQPTQSELPS